jgi:ribose/xylose/arabinose/galactoside ABC-type transport system permease subunit
MSKAETGAIATGSRTLTRLRDIVFDNMIWILLLIGIVVFAFRIPKFFSVPNFLNVLLHSSPLGMLVLAETLVLLTGHFDLSLESTVGFTAMFAAWLMGTGQISSRLGMNPVLAIVVMIATGAVIGLFNGFFVVKLRMNAFIVTLATQIVLRGATINLVNGNIIRNIPKPFTLIAGTKVGPISVMIIVFICIYLVFHFILNSLTFGRRLYAVGDNREAAFASGIKTGRAIISAFILGGALAAVAGWMLSARFEAVAPNLGVGMVFDAMAAAVIGGVSLAGGKGSVIGALGGVLLLGIIQNVLNLSMVSPYYVDMIRGAVVFLAVLLDSLKFSTRRR